MGFIIGILCFATGTFATWNPIDKGSAITLSGGNLAVTQVGNGMVRATVGETTGKWYWEIRNTSSSFGNSGIALSTATLTGGVGIDTRGYGYIGNPANAVYNNNAALAPNHMGTYVTNDIISFALDMDNGAVYMAVNGIWQKNTLNVTGVPTSGVAKTGAIVSWVPDGRKYFPATGNLTGTASTANFGQFAFLYAVPAGFNLGIY